jgi:hypothetical protein
MMFYDKSGNHQFSKNEDRSNIHLAVMMDLHFIIETGTRLRMRNFPGSRQGNRMPLVCQFYFPGQLQLI